MRTKLNCYLCSQTGPATLPPPRLNLEQLDPHLGWGLWRGPGTSPRDGYTESAQGHRKVWDVCRMNVSSDSHRGVNEASGSWTWLLSEARSFCTHVSCTKPLSLSETAFTSHLTPPPWGPSHAGQRLLLFFPGGLQPLLPTLPIAPEHKTEGGTQS